tara:strand:- start:299 stop:514 length:216 start_codon:yes stop_codon:yes gene_type:complete
LNLRPSGYEPDELPGCSTPRQKLAWTKLPGINSLSRFERSRKGGQLKRRKAKYVFVYLSLAGLATTYSPTP